MDAIYNILLEYIDQNNPPKNLVLKMDESIDSSIMQKLKFYYNTGYWVITLNDAKEALLNKIGVKYQQIDFNKHFEIEFNRKITR